MSRTLKFLMIYAGALVAVALGFFVLVMLFPPSPEEIAAAKERSERIRSAGEAVRAARAEAPKAEAPKESRTQKAADAEKAIRRAFADDPNVTSVRAHEMLLYIGISETLYRGMLMDRVGGNRFVRQMARNFQSLIGQQIVTVYFQVGGETVITADFSVVTGEIDVEYRDF